MSGPGSVLTALLWSAAAGTAAWLALLPVRRRRFAGALASIVLTGTAASVGALLGGLHAMVVPMQDGLTLAALAVTGGAVGTAAAAAAAYRLRRDRLGLQQAVRALAQGADPTAGPPLSAELERVREELERTATRLAATRERERALEAARRELVSWVSHDLRTPLAGLRALTEALEDGVADDPAYYYKQIGAAVDRLSALVDDLFDLSRLQAGDGPASVERLALDDLVSDCLAALGPLADAAGVRLVGSAGSRAGVRGDGAQLDRALTNLIANAVRHTEPGGTVTVAARVAGGRAEVSVRDGCGGIPPEDLARVFDVGFRGAAARPQDGGGAGLGLAITSGILAAHRGSVEVANVAGGCRFRVLLPAD